MLKRLYYWVMELAKNRYALPALGVISFCESVFFPVPPDVILIPMILAKRNSAWLYAAICTVCSVLGGLLGYIIGFYLFATIGKVVLNFYGYDQQFSNFQNWYNNYGILIVFVAGLTPLPYKVFTIASGFSGLPVGIFLMGSIVSRGLRFFLEAALLWYFGKPIRHFIEVNLSWIATSFVILLVGGFLLLRLTT